MKNIRPCPYCGGEVEVVRLKDKIDKKDHIKQYRIQCMKCGMAVGRGLKFDKETEEQGKERIKQYEAELDKKFEITEPVTDYKRKKNMFKEV